VFPQPPVKREKGRLHGLHKQSVVAAGHLKNFYQLTLIQGRWLLAEHVLPGFKAWMQIAAWLSGWVAT